MLTYEVEFDQNFMNSVFEDAWYDAVKELEPILTSYARSNHRYKNQTGNLTRTTMARRIGDELSVFSGAGYAKYVHDGHGTWKADPWLRDTIEKNIPLIERIYEKHLQIHFNDMR